MMMDNCDSISLQQQQSPSTPLTPPDPIFASVMIGGDRSMNNGTPHISPTTPGIQSMSFFPTSSAWQQIPQAITPQSQYHHQHSASSPLISSPLSSDFSGIANKSPLPPLPPRGIRRYSIAPDNTNASGSSNLPGSAPLLPPKTYKRIGPSTTSSNSSAQTTLGANSGTSSTVSTTSTKMSYRDKQPPPLPRMPPPSSNHYHQRFNSDIVTTASSSTSPNHTSQSNGPLINRRNSAVENGATLSPRRYSQVPLPPPLPPTPLTSSPQTPMMNMTLFNLLPGSGSPSGIPPNPSSASSLSPTLPPFSSSLHRPPPTPTLATSPNSTNSNNNNNNSNNGPELPPKTYRLSNPCR